MKSSIENDEYTNYVYSKFDIQNSEETTVEVNFDFSGIKGVDWNIGVIYGSSGSGKSTILKQLGNISEHKFHSDKALISNFDFLPPEDAALLLGAMGLSSVPTWLRPFRLLSNGEQYRASLAYAVGSAKEGELILIDEYTSVVDRDVAKAMSFALQKYIRRTNKKIILASCHFDIMEWLLPDWTLSPQKNGGALERGDWLRQGKPDIKLQVSRVEYDTWHRFAPHHYMTAKCNKSCKFFLYSWNDNPIGIVAVIPQPGAGDRRNAVAISRIVVLPDFQGLGVGKSILKHCMGMMKADGNRKVYIKTIHPGLGAYMTRDTENFTPTSTNGKKGVPDKMVKSRLMRIAYSFRYTGPDVNGFEDLVLPVGEMRKLKKQKEK